MTTTKIICDDCTADLSFSHGFETHYLELKLCTAPFDNTFVYDLMVIPPINKDKFVFCGLKCLELSLQKIKSR